MNIDWRKIAWGAGILFTVLLMALAVRFFFGGSPQTPAPQGGALPTSREGTSAGTSFSEEPPPLIATGASSNAPAIFRIAKGPVAAAVFVQAGRPTTTIARYASAADGHVYDLAVDSPGAVPQTISNITIPGIGRALFRADGRGILLRFASSPLSPTIRTVSIQFSASSTNRGAPSIRFLPDELLDVVFSPDGAFVAYLKGTSNGSAGYVARPDGGGERPLFSFPLKSTLLSWPSQGTLFLTTKSAAGASGASFSVNANSGVMGEVLFAPGLTALGAPSFGSFLYQSDTGGGRESAVRNIASGSERGLSFDPLPSKCSWFSSSTLYCAVPLAAVPADYADLWLRGEYSASDSIVRYSLPSGTSTIIASPGVALGAETPDIAALGVSPDERYLFFITKENRALWGVRLR